MGNSIGIPSDVIIICLDYYDVYDQLAQIKKISVLNKKFRNYITYENVDVWIKIAKKLASCDVCIDDGESLFISSLSANVPSKYKRDTFISQCYELVSDERDDAKLWERYYNTKKCIFWKSMCKAYLSHRRIRRQRRTKFATRVMTFDNINAFKEPPKGTRAEEVLICRDTSRSPSKQVSTPNKWKTISSPKKTVPPSPKRIPTQPNTPISVKSTTFHTPSKDEVMMTGSSHHNSISPEPISSKRRSISIDMTPDPDSVEMKQIVHDLNSFVWNEGGLFNISSSSSLFSSPVHQSNSNRLHSHEFTQTSSLLGYAMKFTLASTFIPGPRHHIFNKLAPTVPNTPSSPTKKLLSFFNKSWCGEVKVEGGPIDYEASTMLRDLLLAVGIDRNYDEKIDEEKYQLYWMVGKVPSNMLFDDNDDQYLIVMNLVTHVDQSTQARRDISDTPFELTSTRVAGVHVNADLHKRMITILDTYQSEITGASMFNAPELLDGFDEDDDFSEDIVDDIFNGVSLMDDTPAISLPKPIV